MPTILLSQPVGVTAASLPIIALALLLSVPQDDKDLVIYTIRITTAFLTVPNLRPNPVFWIYNKHIRNKPNRILEVVLALSC